MRAPWEGGKLLAATFLTAGCRSAIALREQWASKLTIGIIDLALAGTSLLNRVAIPSAKQNPVPSNGLRQSPDPAWSRVPQQEMTDFVNACQYST